MAATLASVCSVPLTSVLLLFELTKDYRILLPLMVCYPHFIFVGVTRYILSGVLSYISVGVFHIQLDCSMYLG